MENKKVVVLIENNINNAISEKKNNDCIEILKGVKDVVEDLLISFGVKED